MFRDASYRMDEARGTLMDTVRDNPIPAAMVGIGLAWLLMGGSVVTSLLTLYVVTRVWTKAFWRSREDAPEGHLAAAAPSVLLDEPEYIQFVDRDHVGRMPVGMLLPTGALIASPPLPRCTGRDRAPRPRRDRCRRRSVRQAP